MRRFSPIRAEGALVLGLLGVIAGGTYVINTYAEPTVTTRTVTGAPIARIERVDQGGVKPGPVQPRVVQPVTPPAAVAAPVIPQAPAPPSKKTLVATTPEPAAATPEPVEAEPGALLPGGTEPGTGTVPGTEPGPGAAPGTEPGAEPGPGTTPGCILVLCAPNQPGGGQANPPPSQPVVLP